MAKIFMPIHGHKSHFRPYSLNWAKKNKMIFHHSDKIKVSHVSNAHGPEDLFIYSLASKPLEYTDCEKDLGINTINIIKIILDRAYKYFIF